MTAENRQTSARANLLVSCCKRRRRAVLRYMKAHSRLYASNQRKNGRTSLHGQPLDVRHLALELQKALEHKRTIACGYVYIKGGQICRRAASKGLREPLPNHIAQEELLELKKLYRLPEYIGAVHEVRRAGNALRSALQKLYAKNRVEQIYHEAFEPDFLFGDLTMMYYAVLGYRDTLHCLKRCPSRTYSRLFINKFSI